MHRIARPSRPRRHLWLLTLSLAATLVVGGAAFGLLEASAAGQARQASTTPLPLTGASGIVWAPTDVQVSADALFPGAEETIYEPTVAIDPTDPSRLFALAIDMSTRNRDLDAYATNRMFRSDDGGATWTSLGAVPHGPGYNGDPVVVYDDEGVAYFASLYAPYGGDREIHVFRSDDGGVTWDDGVVAHAAPPRDPLRDRCFSVDKEWLSTGNSPGELLLTYTGTWYTCTLASGLLDGTGEPLAVEDIGIWLRRSSDGGRSWSDALRVSQGTGYALGSQPRVAPDGTLHVAYFAAVPLPLVPCPSALGALTLKTLGGPFAAQVVATSRDDGRTWSHHQQGVCVVELHPSGHGAADMLPSFTYDASEGRAVLAYPTYRPLEDRVTIEVVTSTDGGATWSAPVEATPGLDGAHLPGVVATDGVVRLAYFSTAADGTSHANLAESTDGGATWSAPTRLSTESGAGGGDYIGIDVRGGTIVVMWNDHRDGASRIWARVGTLP